MTDAVQLRYARFAEQEAPGRSELYGEWARGVAADAGLAAILARIPENRRQPPLVFAVTRMLGSGLVGAEAWRDFVIAHADAVVAECTARRLQTNEPLRLAPLLPVLTEVEGPIALLEVGASAGLCLYPDRYSYRVVDSQGGLRAALDPEDGPSTVVLQSTVDGVLPALAMPDIVWRAGIDLAPLDAREDLDRRWLQGLVWPGEQGRAERVDAALDIAAASPATPPWSSPPPAFWCTSRARRGRPWSRASALWRRAGSRSTRPVCSTCGSPPWTRRTGPDSSSRSTVGSAPRPIRSGDGGSGVPAGAPQRPNLVPCWES